MRLRLDDVDVRIGVRMALNLNTDVKEIFSDSSRKQEYPSKTTMNLAMRERAGISRRAAIASAAVAVLAVLLIGKFAVFDQFAAVAAAERGADSVQSTLDIIEGKLAGYDAVVAQYNSYAGNQAASGTVSTIDVLGIVDSCVAPSAKVSTISLDGTKLTVGVSGTDLSTIASIVSKLNAQSNVSAVSVATASDKGSDASGVSATITLTVSPSTTGGAS